jgi:O-antigen ligase
MKKNWIQSSIIYLYYTLFFVTPFVVLPITSELFEFNKIIFIYAIAAAIFSLWVLDSLRRHTVFAHKTPLDIPIIIFMTSQLLSYLFSIDRHTSFFGYYGRFNGGLLSLLIYTFLYYGFMWYVVPSASAIRRFLTITSVAMILVFLWGLPGTFNHDLSCMVFVGKFDNSCWTSQFRPAERMFSTLGQPNWLGAYAAISFFISLYLLLTSKKRISAVVFSLSLFSSFCAILLSRSRSSLASLIPGLLMFAFLFIWHRKTYRAWIQERAVLVGILFIALLGALFIIKSGIPQVDRILSFQFRSSSSKPTPQPQQKTPANPAGIQVGGVTESLDIRKIVWAGAWELGNQYPLFGTGLETFGYAYYQVRPVAHNLTSEWDYLYNKAHNEFLNMFATAGWLGLASYCLLIIWSIVLALIYAVKRRNEQTAVLANLLFISVYFSIIITNIFGFSTTTINLFWFIMPAVLFMHTTGERSDHSIQKPHLHAYIFTGAIFIILLNYLVSYWYADYLYAQSDALMKNGVLESSIYVLEKARALRYEHVYDDKLSYMVAQYAYAQAYKQKSDSIQQLIAKSDELNLQSIRESQINLLYWKTRVKNQYLFYQMTLDKKYLFTGLSALSEAEKLAPTDPKIPYFASTYYTLLFDDEKDAKQKQTYMNNSIKEAEKAIVMKNNYIDAYTLKIQLLKKYKRTAELKAFLMFYLGNVSPTDVSAQKELEQLK